MNREIKFQNDRTLQDVPVEVLGFRVVFKWM